MSAFISTPFLAFLIALSSKYIFHCINSASQMFKGKEQGQLTWRNKSPTLGTGLGKCLEYCDVAIKE